MFCRADQESGAVEVAELIQNKEALKQAIDYAVKLRRVGLVNKLEKLGLNEQLDGQEDEMASDASQNTTATSQEAQEIYQGGKCSDLLIEGETFGVKSVSMSAWGHKSEESFCIFNHKLEDDFPDAEQISSPSYLLPQKCDICGLVLQGTSALTRHCREVHNQETRLNLDKVDVWKYPFRCEMCSD